MSNGKIYQVSNMPNSPNKLLKCLSMVDNDNKN